MATAKKPAVKMDAIGMLIAGHKKVQKAFKDFEKLKEGGSKRGKSDIIRQTCATHSTRKWTDFLPSGERHVFNVTRVAAEDYGFDFRYASKAVMV